MAAEEPRPDTADAREKYLPARQRSGFALCLSGGGFRAALFHLGAVRRLNELGILAQLDAISSVSGGSILAAHLATTLQPWPGGIVGDFESRVAAPFRAFTSKNLRTGPIVRRVLPWNWFNSSTGVEALAAAYEERLTKLTLHDLPPRPNFIVNATDMAFGVNWEFQRARMGDYQAGYATPPPPWPLARAVAASSCFPPVFNPLPVRLQPDALRGGRAKGPKRDEAVNDLRLTDGGNYDNLGLEPVWKSAKVVLVSDGGGTFDAEPDRNLIWRLNRYSEILGNQVGAVRKRWLIAGFVTGTLDGTYWGIGSPTSHYGPGAPHGYSEPLVDDVISEVRTDMDAFDEAEQSVLENHGYLIAEAAIRRHQPSLVASDAAPLSVPHPAWLDESRVRTALATSHERRLPFGR
jgi:NTE family protein